MRDTKPHVLPYHHTRSHIPLAADARMRTCAAMFTTDRETRIWDRTRMIARCPRQPRNRGPGESSWDTRPRAFLAAQRTGAFSCEAAHGPRSESAVHAHATTSLPIDCRSPRHSFSILRSAPCPGTEALCGGRGGSVADRGRCLSRIAWPQVRRSQVSASGRLLSGLTAIDVTWHGVWRPHQVANFLRSRCDLLLTRRPSVPDLKDHTHPIETHLMKRVAL
jgi:hypothetical protein